MQRKFLKRLKVKNIVKYSENKIRKNCCDKPNKKEQ